MGAVDARPVVRSSVCPSSRSREGRRTSPRLDDENEKDETLRQIEAWVPVRTGRPVGPWASAHPPGQADRHTITGETAGGEKQRRSPATYLLLVVTPVPRIVHVRSDVRSDRVPLPTIVHVGSHVHTRVPEDRIGVELCWRGGRTAPVVRSSVSPSSRSREGRRTSPRLDDEKDETLRQSEAWAPVRTGRPAGGPVGQCPPTRAGRPPQNNNGGETKTESRDVPTRVPQEAERRTE